MNVKSNSIVKAGIGYTIGNYLIKGLSFLTIPIFSRVLSTSDYGMYNTYLALESIMCSIIGLALHTSLKNAKYKYKEEYDSYVSAMVFLEVLSMIVWIWIGMIFSNAVYTEFGFSKIMIIFLIVHCTGSSILSIYNVHLSLTYSYKAYIKIAAFNAIFNVILSVVLVLTIFDNKRYLGRIIGTVLPIACIGIYIIYKVWRCKKPRISGEYCNYGILYSLPLIPHAVSQVILNQFYRIMINNMTGASQAGIYSFA